MLKIFKEEQKEININEIELKIDSLESIVHNLSKTLSQKNQKTLEMLYSIKLVIKNDPSLLEKINHLESLSGFVFQCLLAIEGSLKEIQCCLKR